ncbi:sugar nucleotide-binding protein, partial [Bacillus cereus group sp. Bce018]|uniref:sugar nucleotide-binding protein n=1 Tax=Bacillus cereus group sp. Bce018 TaxID=3445248 RepID=UPI003F27BD46
MPKSRAMRLQSSREFSGRAKGGLYHFAGTPDVSWADFAREIFATAGLAPEVVDIPTADYPTPAAR